MCGDSAIDLDDDRCHIETPISSRRSRRSCVHDAYGLRRNNHLDNLRLGIELDPGDSWVDFDSLGLSNNRDVAHSVTVSMNFTLMGGNTA
jgi:hypothetical protein